MAIPPWPKRYQTDNKLLFLAMAPLKVLWQTWGLFIALAYRTPPAKFTLVQVCFTVFQPFFLPSFFFLYLLLMTGRSWDTLLFANLDALEVPGLPQPSHAQRSSLTPDLEPAFDPDFTGCSPSLSATQHGIMHRLAQFWPFNSSLETRPKPPPGPAFREIRIRCFTKCTHQLHCH